MITQHYLDWQRLIGRLLHILRDMAKVTLSVVADLAPEGYGVSSTSTGSFDSSENEEFLGPQGTFITVASWLSIKEIGVFLGTLSSLVSFPNAHDDSQALLSIEQIREIGDSLLHFLLTTRHVGAIEKTYVGLQMLGVQLFKSKVTELSEIPGKWMAALMYAIQTQHHITRRSAGIPYSVIAIMRAETILQSHLRTVTPKFMKVLLEIAQDAPEANAADASLKYQTQVSIDLNSN